jgi:hypothetical protein
MGRLTEITKYGIVGNYNGVENFPLYSLYDETHLDHGLIEQCFNKLAEYEDLEEKISKKFADCISMKTILDAFCDFYDMQEIKEELAQCTLITNENVIKYRQWEEAEEQGLLLKLPCKVGDTVYQHMITGLDEDKKPIYKVFEARVFKYILDSMNLCFWTETKDRYQYQNEMPITAFGETVFATKEEAEAALERVMGE